MTNMLRHLAPVVLHIVPEPVAAGSVDFHWISVVDAALPHCGAEGHRIRRDHKQRCFRLNTGLYTVMVYRVLVYIVMVRDRGMQKATGYAGTTNSDAFA